MPSEINTVGVVGLGTMGAGIVEVMARGGVDVVAVDSTAEATERGRGILQRSTDRAVSRGRMSEPDRATLLGRVRFASRTSELADCDLVIEAVPELLDLKRRIFGELDAIVSPGAVLASNTSSLSLTDIAVSTAHPGRVVGMHFFNPAPVQKLVEVICTVVADEAVVEAVRSLAERLGKMPVVVGDRAGFIGNALLFGYLGHAVTLVETGHATREDVDAAMRLGAGLPMGPFALLDLIGLDTAHEICRTMYAQTHDRLHAPSPLLGKLVTAGLLGRKSGRGFYTYDRPGGGTVVPDALTPPDEPADGSAVSSVGVVGSGPLATSLAQACRRGGYAVTTVPAPGAAAELAELASADLVVDAVDGDAETTLAVLAELDRVCDEDAILATTQRSMLVVEAAAATDRPTRVVGLHLPGTAAEGQAVEVVRGFQTVPAVVATAMAFGRGLGLTPVGCGDRAGRIVEALLFPYLNDAVKMLGAGYAGVDDIDTAMKRGCGYPAGPFEVLDEVGLDVALAALHALHAESREPGLAPAPLLGQLVTAGYLGRKTGRGFRVHA